jgi:hypothetical protein
VLIRPHRKQVYALTPYSFPHKAPGYLVRASISTAAIQQASLDKQNNRTIRFQNNGRTCLRNRDLSAPPPIPAQALSCLGQAPANPAQSRPRHLGTPWGTHGWTGCGKDGGADVFKYVEPQLRKETSRATILLLCDIFGKSCFIFDPLS